MINHISAPKLLLLTNWFPPAYKAGGLIQAAANLANALTGHFEVFVIASASDLGASEPLKHVEHNQWVRVGPGLNVLYLTAGMRGYSRIYTSIKQIEPARIFVNGLFSFQFSVFPMMLALLGIIKTKTIISPRGMLRGSAMAFKNLKKRGFIHLLNFFGIHRVADFHATDEVERQDVLKYFEGVEVKVIPDCPATTAHYFSTLEKKVGVLNCVFVGRIHPIKNLLYILQVLQTSKLQGELSLTIIGPIEDDSYWQDCQKIISALPENIKVDYQGMLPQNEVVEALSTCHLLVSPTSGENFGYAIVEALQNYRPVLISDQTPWSDLKRKEVGWDLPLIGPQLFTEALQIALDWDQQTFNKFCLNAHQYINHALQIEVIQNKYVTLFSQPAGQ